MQWCGLKFLELGYWLEWLPVTTDAVVWIEIMKYPSAVYVLPVTTDAVVWIEIWGKLTSISNVFRHH